MSCEEHTVKEQVVVADDNGGAWFTLGILATVGTAAVAYWAKEATRLKSRVANVEEGLSQVTKASTAIVHELKELKDAMVSLHNSKKPSPKYPRTKGNGEDAEAAPTS